MDRGERIIGAIILREGSRYTNNPVDMGGPTKYGITLATLARFRRRKVTPEEVEALTEQEARAVYRELYINLPNFNKITNEPLAELLIDSGVQHGAERATRWLQEVLGVKQDGVLGPITQGEANTADPAGLYRQILAIRCRFYGRIIERNHSQATFAAGWANRLAEFIEWCP